MYPKFPSSTSTTVIPLCPNSELHSKLVCRVSLRPARDSRTRIASGCPFIRVDAAGEIHSLWRLVYFSRDCQTCMRTYHMYRSHSGACATLLYTAPVQAVIHVPLCCCILSYHIRKIQYHNCCCNTFHEDETSFVYTKYFV